MVKKTLIVSALAGFIGTFLTHDIETLKSMGYEVHCAGNARNKDPIENENSFRAMGVTFHQVDFSSKSPLSRDSLKAFKEIKQLLKEEKFDLVHCHTPIAGAITRVAAMPYRKRVCGGTTVIYTSHGFYFHKGSSKKTWVIYYTIEKAMSALCDAIITINSEDYETAKRMLCKNVFHINGVGCDTEKYRNVQIDRDIYRRSLGVESGQVMILDIGELSPRKNHKTVINAVAKLNNKNVVLVICGKAISGSRTFESLKMAAEEGHANVVFAGHKLDIPVLCQCADLGVLSSTREGLGMVGIEMMAAGLPLVTSNVHGIKDYMVDGKTGFMCAPYDVDAFAIGMEKLCNPEIRDSFRQNCVASAARFDVSISAEQMKQIYSELLT